MILVFRPLSEPNQTSESRITAVSEAEPGPQGLGTSQKSQGLLQAGHTQGHK